VTLPPTTGMIRVMKIKASLPILPLIVSCCAAQVHAEGCAAPPYGASMDAYNVFIAEGHPSGDAIGLLAKICKMKYEAADRTELVRAGFTPEDIEHSSTVMLTSEYLGVLKYVAFQNEVHGQQPPKPGAPLPPPSDYQAMSVRDFAADGPKLAARSAKVTLTGSYLFQADHGMLYPDMQSIVISKYHPDAGPQPQVLLLTNDASRQLRQRLLACQTDLSAAQVGCTIKIRGQARMCPLPDTSGTTHEVPCLNAEDGK
jgi:hypothetical protein